MNTEEFLEHQKRIMIDAINETQSKQSTEGLRDYFAAAALQGFCSGPEYGLAENKAAGLTWTQVTTKYAYEIADAMLKERERGGMSEAKDILVRAARGGMSEAKDILVRAARQYRHNDNSGFVGGYEYGETQKIVQAIVDSRDELLEALEMALKTTYSYSLHAEWTALIAKAKGEV